MSNEKKVSPNPKVGVNPNDVASAPSAGGTVRAGKDSTDCDDTLRPERHHSAAPEEAKVVSGRGPAAAKRQIGTAGWN
jgi:hypothetical protein